MNQNKSLFLEQSENKAQDLKHKHTISFNIDKYNAAVINGKQQFTILEDARMRAKNTKWDAIEHLDKHLESFEKKFTERGGKVIWAETANDALAEIATICQRVKARSIVKSKSMVTEEIHLNKFLESIGIESIETDLGEYIQQLDNEPPYHIVTPAMHKSKEDVAKLFHEKLHVAPNLTPPELTMVAREKLRNKFIKADIGITGGNFLLADVGGICLTENEGNARLTTTLPKIHIAIVGIEKVLPSINDLSLFWPLLSTHGTGQKLTAYNSILLGPRQIGENDGPEEMYVILLDNGRTNLLRKEVRQSLFCIRCGSCLNACPVYKNIGGHTYKTTYSGPIGAVITPHLKGMEEYGHLSYASSLCGNCTQVCPVRIDLHEMLLANRSIYNQEAGSKISEKIAWSVFQKGVMSRPLMNMAGGTLKNLMFKKVFKPVWGDRRSVLEFTSKSFNQQWKSSHKK